MEDDVIDIDDEPIDKETASVNENTEDVNLGTEDTLEVVENPVEETRNDVASDILEENNLDAQKLNQEEICENDELVEDQNLLITIEKGEQISLGELVKTLVKKETRPHILLILAVAIPLHVLASFETLILPVSIAYLSISISYILIAYVTRYDSMKKFVSTDTNQDIQTDVSFVKRNFSSLKILLFPIILSAFLSIPMILIFSEGSRFQAVGNILPELLGSLFLLWAIGQARSFRASTNSFLEGWYDKREIKQNNSIIISFIVVISLVIVTGFVLLYLFRGFHSGFDLSLTSLVTNDWLFLIFLASVSIIVILTTKNLIESVEDNLFRKKSFAWMTLCSLFIVWHGLTIYRKLIITDSAGFGSLIEEVILMLLTIVMAIWSLTSSQAKSEFPLVTKDNALFVGISFGYAYAGSVAMLTSALEGINVVIAAGHGIALFSLLILLRTTVKAGVGKYQSNKRIQNLVKIEGNQEHSS